MTKLNCPSWDLSDFYTGIKDEAINADLSAAKKMASEFADEFEGKIAAISGDLLLKAIENYQEICEKIAKVGSFSYLIYASDLSNQDFVAFHQDVSEKIAEIEKDLVFFSLEINKIEDLEAIFVNFADLEKFRPFLRDLRVFRKHQLSKDLEKFALEKNIAARDGWVRLFDETVNNLEFSYREKTLSSQEIFDLMSDADENVRKDAALAISETLAANSKVFAFITNILAKNKGVEDSWRGFERPISSRNLANFVEDEVVDVLVETVKKNYAGISEKYYKIKAKMLGKERLGFWDRNAPLADDDERISWDEAKDLVLEAYEEFDPKMREIGEMFFDKNWIDADVRKGKDSGAFSHPCVPSVHPYILMNYQGKVRDVMTLAHELGHGIHQFLAADQGYLMADTPLTLAETASVFGEQLVFRKILAKEKDEKRRKLIIAGKVEDMINTAVRQIAFLEFERKIHDARKNGEVPLQKICDFWMEVQSESFGEAINLPKEYQYFWSYIPHFIHSPFYVYAYAFGDCLVNSLYRVFQKNEVEGFVEKYREMLASGGTKHHGEMLAPFGLDAKDPQFWQGGLDVIKGFVDDLEGDE